jgi:hypothetical protein
MFLKEKFTASGEFEKLKARLVAGGINKTRDSMKISVYLLQPFKLPRCWPSQPSPLVKEGQSR